MVENTLWSWIYDPTFGKFLTAGTILVLILLVSRLTKGSITRYVKANDTRYRLRKFATITSYILIILMVSIVFSERLGGLTVALGVAGAGVAFALQEVIASFAGWFAVSFAGFYKPGDRVQLGGIKGDVIDVSFLRTTVMEIGECVKGDQYTGRVVRIANSFVFKEPVFNYSGDFPFLWDEIKVPVKYGGDHHLARKILLDVATEVVGEYSTGAAVAWQDFSKQYLLEEAITDPIVSLVLNDNWMEFTVRFVLNYKRRRGTKDALFTRVLDEFAKTDGKVEIASATVHLI
jgi:small-conductance mechanosensitive channel